MNLNRIVLVALFTILTGLAYAQDQNSENRFYVGGNFDFQFGTGYTLINVSPLVGYKITEKLSGGVGGTYIYYKYKNPYYYNTYKTNIYGGNIFARYFLLENIFAHMSYEELNLEIFPYPDFKAERVWVPAFFIGGGYQIPLGGKGFAQLMILYETIQDLNSPYENPVIRIGFGFSL